MAAMTRQQRDTGLFILLLLLGGVMHSRDAVGHFTVSVMYCAEYLLYAGLILAWMQSINRRLLPTREKQYLLAAACLMLLFLAAQFTKFRIAVNPTIARYCWYIYYLPILLIPTLFLMTCFSFYRGTGRGKPVELAFLIPASLLALGVLTNDLHQLAFIAKGDIAEVIGRSGTYTHGFLYYAAYAWAGCTLAAGIFFLLATCRKRGSWKKAVWPLGILILIPVFLTVRGMIPKNALLDAYEWPEIVIFGMLGVLEACIRSRLIPSNENYPGFFAQMDVPVLITDRELRTAFRTQAPVTATDEQLRASLVAPVYPEPDTRLSGMEIRAGYAFWTEDEGTVNRLNEELRDANEVLALENEVLARERELAAEQAGIEERSRLYQRAAQEVYPTQKKISAILDGAQPGTASFPDDIRQALVLTAYVKRKANFVLVEAERETVSARELAAALEESVHYLCCCGMDAAADVQAQRAFGCREAMAIYDIFEAIAEGLLGKAKALFVRLSDDELLMMADGEAPADGAENPAPVNLSDLPLPVCQSVQDGQLVFRVALGASGSPESPQLSGGGAE